MRAAFHVQLRPTMTPIPALLSLLAQTSLTTGSAVSAEACSFGEIYQFSHASCSIHLTNSSDRKITVSIAPQVKEDQVQPDSVTIAPHGSADVVASVAVGNGVGEFMRMFRVSDGSGGRDLGVMNSGFALTALDEAHPRVDFGSVDLSEKAPEARTVPLDSHDAPGFRVTKVLAAPHSIDVSIADDGHAISLRIRPDADWGLVEDYVKVAIDSPDQKEAWIAVKAEIHGGVAAASNPVWMGIVPPDAERKIQIRLDSRNKEDFRVTDIALSDLDGEAKLRPCEPAADGCKVIELHVSDAQRPGAVRGAVSMNLPDYSRRMSVAVWGVLQGPPPKKIDEVRQPAPASVADAQAEGKPKADAASAGDPNAVPAGRGPLLKWSVGDDSGVHGYQIFRSTSESGPFLLISRPSIATKQAREKGTNAYAWRDVTAQVGETYWYYIGSVGKDGGKRKLSSPLKKVVTD
jgi:hypothetical protein